MNFPIQPVDGNNPFRAADDVRRIDPTSESEDVKDAEQRASGTARESLVNLSEKISFEGRTAEFTYDSDLDRVIVKIYKPGSEPKEVIREIPDEQYRAFASRFREMIGVLFDEQA